MSSTQVAEPGWRAVATRDRATEELAEPAAPRRLAVVVRLPRRPRAAPRPAPVTGAEPPRAARPAAALGGASRVAVRPPGRAGVPAGQRPAAKAGGPAERRPAVRVTEPAGRRPAARASERAGQGPAARPAASAGRRPAAPLRLTRRGRVVLGAFMVLAALAVMTLLAVGSAGGAPVSGHQPAGAGYRGMTRIVVRPGQSLWSIAAAADPSADPRIVIQEIISANALTGTSIQAGQLLWVPKPSS
jgi:LysM domain